MVFDSLSFAIGIIWSYLIGIVVSLINWMCARWAYYRKLKRSLRDSYRNG